MHFPASLTKVATTLYALQKKEIDFGSFYTVSSEALSRIEAGKKQEDFLKYPPYILEHDGSTIDLKPGEIIPIWTLVYGALIASGNDACNALAEAVAGSIPQFMEEINEYIRSLGCEGSYFQNPHGLHHPSHVCTALDLAKIAQAAVKNPYFREIMKLPSFTIPKTNRHSSRTLNQTNRLLLPGKYQYSPAIGMKTGYTASAKHNLIAVAEKEGRCLIAVILGCPERNQRYEDAITLFESAFAEEKQREIIFPKGKTFTKEIAGAALPLVAKLKEELAIEEYPSEKEPYQAFVHWENISLPIQAGQIVGKLSLKEQTGKVRVEKPLYAEKKVEKTWWNKIFPLP